MNIKLRLALSRFPPIARYLLVPALATSLELLAFPSLAAEEAVLEQRDAAEVMDSAVMYYHQKNVERRVVEAVCYFDPKVEATMRCSWVWSEGAADSFMLKQRVDRRAKKWCKEAGGRGCIEFWRNGRLRFDGLAAEQAELLESVFAMIPEYDAHARPLPGGVDVSRSFSEWVSGGPGLLGTYSERESWKKPPLRHLCE